MSLILLASLFPLFSLVSAVVVPSTSLAHSHDSYATTTTPGSWYHQSSHPVHTLFRRAPDDGIEYPPVGSPAWSSGFPRDAPDPAQLPRQWVDALNAAVSAGKIPSIPISQNTPGTNPTYPGGANPNSPGICSATYKCRHVDDIWDAPNGVFASSFDDGPQPACLITPKLVDFLRTNNVTTTHFMIGKNLLFYPSQFQMAFSAGHDIAVHTWTHPYMTTLSNEQILGELGWTMLLIHNSTGGRVPRYWRPPYGDSDNRVRAIAKEVFGLTTVIWNQDTRDWSLTTNGTTPQIVQSSMHEWISGPKSPGLIILEHEVSDQSVSAFIEAYPSIRSNGWNFASLAQVVDGKVYQNADNSTSAVTMVGIMPGSISSASGSSTSTLTTASSSSSSGNTMSAESTNSVKAFNAATSLQGRMSSAKSFFLMALSFLAVNSAV
ncbi:carbohydrate esterase family 4 protein [Amanita thiersii Skay4041]|uniref:chitin deacetylase n=1 Tax=Amanita thiersii Skay4041 TaxID=703135 RepID=A0A2A9NP16_9AGAR|nr:carbohydrate esterase family 4 protein [Amanita thiersii Skay4041]